MPTRRDSASGIDKESVRVSPIDPDPHLRRQNPLGKIPCLVLDNGQALYDSRVICEYLDRMHGGRRFVPSDGQARWAALTLQALADGMMDAAVGVRYEETLRPEAVRWETWTANQKLKIRDGLDWLEDEAAGFPALPDIGHIAVASALGYLDFRFDADGWREGRPKLEAWFETFSGRPSMQATKPV